MYRLFGDFCLEDPANHLNPQQIRRLRGLETSFAGLECNYERTSGRLAVHRS
jgi:hypothetical protein